MKKVVVALIVAVFAVGGLLLAVKLNKKDATVTPAKTADSSMADMDNNSSSEDNTPQAASKVTIESFAFAPKSIQVKKGTTVSWVNNDSAAHTVTGDSGGPDSQSLSKGDTYTFTFDTVGTFPYHCAIHPDMTGTVTVVE
jgi:plastocyanin